MAKSFSNIGTKFFLDVSLMPFFPDGSKPSMSITSPNFPNEKLIEFIRSDDQQLIGLQELIDEFIEDYPLEEDRLGMADYLEMLAQRIRSAIK